MNKAEAEGYLKSLLHDAANSSLMQSGAASSRDKHDEYLHEGWFQYLVAIYGQNASVTPDVAAVINLYGGSPELIADIAETLGTVRAFGLGGEYGYELFARYMEKALGRQLGDRESEIARQIHLRSQSVHAFWQARQSELAGGKLDELIARVSDISSLFPHGQDVNFGKVRPLPFFTPTPIPTVDWLEESPELDEAIKLQELENSLQMRENEEISNIERDPSPYEMMGIAFRKFQDLKAQREAEAALKNSVQHAAAASGTGLSGSDNRTDLQNFSPEAEEADRSSGILEFADALLTRQVDDVNDPITAKTADQTRAVLRLFVEATGRTEISQIRQKDLAHFKKVMLSLPPTYRKSPGDREKSLDQIIEEAALKVSGARVGDKPAKIGLSSATVNRNLTFLAKIIKHATAEGKEIDMRLNPGLLRMGKQTRDNEDRPPFTKVDVERIFLHPVWQGQRSATRRNLPGPVLVKDALYWLPLMAVYTGCRLEEIAGLKLNEVLLEHDVPHISIAKNENRRLKNAQSKRLIPLHPILLALGFDQYVEVVRRDGAVDLFPDAKPARSGTFGRKIDSPFRRIVEQQLGEDAWVDGAKKTFHSFRHYFAGEIVFNLVTDPFTKKDLLGHLHEDVTSEVYGKIAPLPIKLELMTRLPEIAAISGLLRVSPNTNVVVRAKPRPVLRLRQPKVAKSVRA